MEDSSDIGGIIENYQVIPAINKLDENYFEPDFYPADGGEPAYESGDATAIGEGLGEYETGGGGSHDDFMSELGETDEAFANAFGDGIKRFGRKLRSDSKKRQAKRKRKRRRGQGTVARNLAAGRGGPRRGKPRRTGPPPRMSNPNRGPSGGNAPKPGASADVREMDAQIRKFASEPVANMSGDATKYGNGWGE